MLKGFLNRLTFSIAENKFFKSYQNQSLRKFWKITPLFFYCQLIQLTEMNEMVVLVSFKSSTASWCVTTDPIPMNNCIVFIGSPFICEAHTSTIRLCWWPQRDKPLFTFSHCRNDQLRHCGRPIRSTDQVNLKLHQIQTEAI